MVFQENRAHVKEVRSSRYLFVREAHIGCLATNVAFQVLFVHGICGSERHFRSLLEHMDRFLTEVNIKIHCLLFDFVGCGKSPARKEWNAYEKNETMQDIEVLLRMYFDQSIPCVILGHSYGPSVFLPLLRKCLDEEDKLPMNLVGCILLSTMLQYPESSLKDGGLPIFDLPAPILNILKPLITKKFIELAVHPDHKDLRILVAKACNANNMYVAKAYYKHSRWATMDDLVDIQEIPTLIIHGSDDLMIPKECGHTLAQSLSRSEFVAIEKASHLVMVEQPEEVARAISSFLQKLTTTQCSS